MSLPEDLSLNCRNIMFLSKVLNWRPGAKIKFIREATESAQPDWELDVQQRSYFVLITIVSMYGISNTSHQIMTLGRPFHRKYIIFF